MSNMEFENESRSQSYLYSKLKASNEPPAIIKFLIKHGIVKSENAADVLIIVFVIFVIIVSLLLIKINHSSQIPSVESVINSVNLK